VHDEKEAQKVLQYLQGAVNFYFNMKLDGPCMKVLVRAGGSDGQRTDVLFVGLGVMYKNCHNTSNKDYKNENFTSIGVEEIGFWWYTSFNY